MGGIPVKEKFSKAMVGLNRATDRVLELKLAVGSSLIIFVVVYAPQVRIKCVKSIAPKYLGDLIKKCTAPRVKTSANDNLLLEIQRIRLVTAGDRSFAQVAQCLLNELPYALRAVDAVKTFKTLLKTFLFQRHFN